ncbi:hypothetical protein [Gloeobacter morelensis]|uniref:Uncharacterized protein n=1 Tax=Gloeobacter morelensis MG652769 TaxID=2781736 RepID=A0ABY3PI19_9CYAN|nr:hypothetical protein [Gloeobacter morelensis]UFP93310.1 hypothetical protein ISF26_16080 [Gloeobacter morelensis MG652769]
MTHHPQKQTLHFQSLPGRKCVEARLDVQLQRLYRIADAVEKRELAKIGPLQGSLRYLSWPVVLVAYSVCLAAVARTLVELYALYEQEALSGANAAVRREPGSTKNPCDLPRETDLLSPDCRRLSAGARAHPRRRFKLCLNNAGGGK